MRVSASVIVVAYDSGPGLLSCVASVWADEPDWEVIVVDNGAGGDEIDAVVRAGRATVVKPHANLGFGGGCNLGARVAAGDRLVFLNPDTIVPPGALRRLVAPLGDPDVAISTGRLRLLDRPELLHAEGTVIHVSGLGWSGGYGTAGHESTEIVDVTAPCGAAMAMRAETFRELGGFHDELFLYQEDVELGWRARMSGGRVVCSPGADIYHNYDFERHAGKRYFMERNRIAFLGICFSARTLLLLSPVLLATEAAMLVLAVRQGWLRAKLAGWLWLLRNGGMLLRRRRETQRRRRVGDRELAGLLTAVVDPGMLEVPAFVRLLNPLLLVYWAAARRAL
ncbi:MAG TPA: glycosyltransferase family 2 protein [Gaiellaceae bacterium]